MNKSVIGYIDRKFYADYPSNWDNKLFRSKILPFLNKHVDLLDLGAGSGYVKEMNFRNEVHEVTGIDADPAVADNPFLHHYIAGRIYDLPDLTDQKFDIVICNSVIEHIDNPEKFVEVVSKVLKPGGYFFGKTPNRNHYMPVAARLTPLSFHKWFNQKRGRPGEHTFETHYLLNTPKMIRKFFSAQEFEILKVETFEGPPSYLRMNFLFYLAGWLYERTVSALGMDALKMVMIFSVRKRRE